MYLRIFWNATYCQVGSLTWPINMPNYTFWSQTVSEKILWQTDKQTRRWSYKNFVFPFVVQNLKNEDPTQIIVNIFIMNFTQRFYFNISKLTQNYNNPKITLSLVTTIFNVLLLWYKEKDQGVENNKEGLDHYNGV